MFRKAGVEMSTLLNSFIMLEILNFIFQSIQDIKQKWYYSHILIILVSVFACVLECFGVFYTVPIVSHVIALYVFFKLYDMDVEINGAIIVLSLMNYYAARYYVFIFFLVCFHKNIWDSPIIFDTIMTLVLCFLLSFAIIWMFKNKAEYQNKETNKLIFTMPIVTIAVMATMQYVVLNSYWFVCFVVLGLSISNYILFYYFFQSMENIRLRTELEIKKNQLQVSKKHTELLNKQYRLNSEYFHLLLHRISDINKELDVKDETIKKQLSEIMDDIDTMFNNTLTNTFV